MIHNHLHIVDIIVCSAHGITCPPQIVELLLDNGAHIDLRNAHGQRPTSMMRNVPECQINPLRYTTLRCLAAAAVTKHGLRYVNAFDFVLNIFKLKEIWMKC